MLNKCLLVDEKGPFSDELIEKMAIDLCNKLNYLTDCKSAIRKYKFALIIRLNDNDIKINNNTGELTAKFLLPTSEVIPIKLTWVINPEDPFGKLAAGIDHIWDADFPEKEIRKIVKKAMELSSYGISGEIILPDVEMTISSKMPLTSTQLTSLKQEFGRFRDYYKIYLSELNLLDSYSVQVHFDCFYTQPDFELLFEKILGIKGFKGNISIKMN